MAATNSLVYSHTLAYCEGNAAQYCNHIKIRIDVQMGTR